MCVRGACAAASLLALLPACAFEEGAESRGNVIRAAKAGSAATGPDTPVSSSDRVPHAAPPRGPTADCPIIDSSDWAAAVIGLPPDSPDRLRVTGKVTVPSGGYHLNLQAGPVLEIHPPIQRIELAAVPPVGTATMAIETHDVRGEFPALSEYGEVQVHCGKRLLASIREIAWTQ